MPATVRITQDRVDAMFKSVSELAKQQVLVGIPSTTAGRNNPKGQSITNAQIGYIHEFGSPRNNIPPRPFLRPGVSNATDRVEKMMRKAALFALDGKMQDVQNSLHAMGLVAVSAVRAKITSGPFIPLSPVTIAKRRARGVLRTKPLIDTGQLRQAITYVIRRK